MRKHLRRLERVWIDWPIYFITTCTSKRRWILTSKGVAKILVDEWRNAHDRHGWAIGRYVIMPDHVHFFLLGRVGWQNAASVYAGMEAVDEQTNSARAQFFWKRLAGRVLRSYPAFKRELQSKVGLRQREPGAGWIRYKL
jgi:REP element-mobilizing transposase RayT